jgi:hypothetical protein
MTLIPDLEDKLIRAAERQALAAASASPAKKPARHRGGKVLNVVGISLVMAITLLIGGGALILLSGHKAAQVHNPTTGGHAVQTTRQQLISSLAVLQRPQTTAERAFSATGWPQPPRTSGMRAVLDRPLIRLVTSTPSGDKIFIVPLQIIGRHSSTEAVALWFQSIGWSDYFTVSEIQTGGAWGPFHTTTQPETLHIGFFEIVPNGVSKVIFYNATGTKLPLRFNGSSTVRVTNNFAHFTDQGGARIVFASWYSPAGRLIKRVGPWSLTHLNHFATPQLRNIQPPPLPNQPHVQVRVVPGNRYCTPRRGQSIEPCPGQTNGLVRLGGPHQQWLVIFSLHAPKATNTSGQTYYYFTADAPGNCPNAGQFGEYNEDVQKGQQLTLWAAFDEHCPGPGHGTVSLITSKGAHQAPGQGASHPIANFDFTIPKALAPKANRP